MNRASAITLRWQPSNRQRRLFTLAALALLTTLATQRAILAVLAVPPAWLLLRPYLGAAFSGRTAVATALSIESFAEPQRCLEGECVDVRVRVRVEGDRVILDQPAAEARRRLEQESRSSFFRDDDDRSNGPHMLNRSFSGTYER